jgi:Ran GTPase-activating protein (RanGAP) involved in mRNA processing and transport
MDRIRDLENLVPLLENLRTLKLNCTNLLLQLCAPVEFFNVIEKNKSLKELGLAALSEDQTTAKTFKLLLRAVRRNQARGGRIKSVNVSENYMSPACFHALKDVVVKNRNVKTLKFYS